MSKINYQKFILDNFLIVDKQSKTRKFKLNQWQEKFLNEMTGRDVILKSRQIGFSSVILAIFATDFILNSNSYQVVLADNRDNAVGLLERVKYFIESYEILNKIKIPLKYNSRHELVNQENNSHYIIATAENKESVRSKTITNLHLSEAAFYADFERITASAFQAVPESGRIIIETTANGYNQFKTFWGEDNGFKKHFFGAKEVYSDEFLAQKKLELKRLYSQEYPTTAEEAFLTSGECFFDNLSIVEMLREAENVKTI